MKAFVVPFVTALVFLFVLAVCAPNIGEIPKILPMVATGNCAYDLVEMKDVEGTLCPAPMLAVGIVSISPTVIRCAIIDMNC